MSGYLIQGSNMAKDIERKVTKKSQIRIERERKQKRYLIIGTLIVLILTVGLVSYAMLDRYVFTQYKPVAKVNGEAINVKDFQKQVRYERWQLIQQYYNTIQTSQMFGDDPTFSSYFETLINQLFTQLNNPEQIGESVLNYMIDDLVIEQQATKMGIEVTEAEIEETLQAVFGYSPKGTPTPKPTFPVFGTSTLSPTQIALVNPAPTHTVEATSSIPTTEVTVSSTSTISPTLFPSFTPTLYTLQGYQDQVKQYLEMLEEVNYTEDDLKSIVRNQLLRQKVSESITVDLPRTEERVWARHMLLASEDEAKDVIFRLKSGEDFAILAAELSLDTASKSTGGDLGWFGRGQMVEEFENIAFNLIIGEISEPVKTDFGYHVIQVLGHEDVFLNETEFANLRAEKFNEWLSSQKEAMEIETFDTWKNVLPTEPNISVGS